MLDFGRCDERQFSLVRQVVEELRTLSDIDPRDIMIVGACCRDILHAGFGHDFSLLSTTDVDVAIALPKWAPFDELTQRLQPTGATGIRYFVKSIPVDLMPFGDVEDPVGTVTPALRDESMDVFAFREVFENSLDLNLADDLQIRIPTPAGYCALKMSAWANRSAYREYRDAPDPTYWYAESTAIQNRVYDTDDGIEILMDVEMDVTLAAARTLGRDVADEIGPALVQQLKTRWSATDRKHLVQRFGARDDAWMVFRF